MKALFSQRVEKPLAEQLSPVPPRERFLHLKNAGVASGAWFPKGAKREGWGQKLVIFIHFHGVFSETRMPSGRNNTPETSGAYRPELILDKIPVH
jgi:hypothetical protein